MGRGFLLDTNVPSELIRPAPDPKVVAWVNSRPNSALHLSAVSVGELRKGLSLLPEGRRRKELERWFGDFLLPLFGPRILPATQNVADCWGRLSASRTLSGKPLSMADGLIAATALEYELALVTRNARDFVGLNLPIVNPWDDN